MPGEVRRSARARNNRPLRDMPSADLSSLLADPEADAHASESWCRKPLTDAPLQRFVIIGHSKYWLGRACAALTCTDVYCLDFTMIFICRHGSQATSGRAQKRDAEATSAPRAVKRPEVLHRPFVLLRLSVFLFPVYMKTTALRFMRPMLHPHKPSKFRKRQSDMVKSKRRPLRHTPLHQWSPRSRRPSTRGRRVMARHRTRPPPPPSP